MTVVEALYTSAFAVHRFGLEWPALFLGTIESLAVVSQEHTDVLFVAFFELVAVEVVQAFDGHAQTRRQLAGPWVVVIVAVGVVGTRVDASPCFGETRVTDLGITAVFVVGAF